MFAFVHLLLSAVASVEAGLGACPSLDGEYSWQSPSNAPSTWSECELYGGDKAVWVAGTGNVYIANSKFTGFTASSALVFGVTGYVSLFEVDLKDFRCGSGGDIFAVKVGAALELLAERCRFSNFTNEGLIYASDNVPRFGGGARYLLTLYDVTATDVLGVSSEALIDAGFDSFYFENLAVRNAHAHHLVTFTSGAAGIPVIRRLNLTNVTTVAGLCSDRMTSYFVIDGGILQDSEDDTESHGTTFYDGVTFVATEDYTGCAVKPNGEMALIGCLVRGFKVGIRVMESGAKFLVCGTVFDGCRLAIEARQGIAEIVGCYFAGYEQNAIVSMAGGKDGDALYFVIRGCVFSGGEGADISFKQYIKVVDCCSASQHNLAQNFEFGEVVYEGQNCAKEVSSSPEGCSSECGGLAAVNTSLCDGGMFTARPTWARTATSIAPRREATTELTRATVSEVPVSSAVETPSVAIPASPTPSVAISDSPTAASASRPFVLTEPLIGTSILTDSTVVQPTSVFSATPSLAASAELIATNSFLSSLAFLATGAFRASATLSASVVFPVTKEFLATSPFAASAQFPASLVFPASAQFAASVAFAASAQFSASLVFTASAQFAASLAFPASAQVLASLAFPASAQFRASRSATPLESWFSRHGTLLVPVEPAPPEQDSGGLGTGGAVGIGVAGVIAIAALLTLLLFLKRRKQKPEEPEGTVSTETTLEAEEDDGRYISEYGLSDGVRPVDHNGDAEDLPRVDGPEGDYHSDMENASEHNPEELGDGAVDSD
jgi:hypothetical protein